MNTESVECYIGELKAKRVYQFQNVSNELPGGWIKLLGILSGLIDEKLEQKSILSNRDKSKVFKGFSQIKEKFGGARFYVHGISSEKDVVLEEELRALISDAERISFCICEQCGDSGELRSANGWKMTLCEKHYDEYR